MLAAAAFAIDLGHVSYTRCKLVSAAQGGAVAAAEQLPNSSVARTEAQLVSKLNYANGAAGDVVVPQDVEFGDWNPNAREVTVVADPDKANAVRVTARLSEATGNPLALFMGHIMGRDTADVSATAIASRQLFGHGSACVHVTSTKDLSNVVLEFADGATQKFDGLNEPTGVFEGTGQHVGKFDQHQ